MSYAAMALWAGIAAIGALLLAQWRLLGSRPEHLRTERLRAAIYLALLFASFATLHWHLTQAERAEEPCCLRVFDMPEERPAGSEGRQLEPPPAPPRPPDRLSSRPSPPAP